MKNKSVKSVKVCVFQGQRLIAWTWLRWIKWFKGNTRRLKPPSCERKTCWIVHCTTLLFWLVQHFLACSKSWLILSFLHVSSPLLPEMEFFYILLQSRLLCFPQIMVFPATHFTFYAKISNLFKTIIFMLYFCIL